jgi:hypothetical protein
MEALALDEKHVVALIMGPISFLIGFFMATSPKFAAWSVSRGRGRLWAALLGKERAVALTRFGFGPLAMILGILGVCLGLFDR